MRYTLSPAIHTAAFKALGLEWIYLAWPVPPESLDAALGGLRALRCAGANLTMPHKQSALRHLDELTPDARAIGAVNTIECRAERLVGHNTDVSGLAEFLASDAGVNVGGRRALVLGAGGAARAAVTALGHLGAVEVEVIARNPKAAASVAALGPEGRDHGLEWDGGPKAALDADIVVNATPLGMKGERLLPGVAWRAGQAVVDLVYDPPTTPLLEAARVGGADAWGGIGMLVRQAAGALRIWTGREAPLEVMSASAVRAIGRRHAKAIGS